MLRTITCAASVLSAAALTVGVLHPTALAQSTGSLGSSGPGITVPMPDPPTDTPEPTVPPAPAPPVTAVIIGDSFTQPAKVGTPVDNWAEIVAERFCWEPTYLAKGGSGYHTLPGLIRYEERIPAATAVEADVIVVQGSTNDTRPFSDGTLAGPVTETLAELARLNPQAQIVVLGPTKPVVTDEVRARGLRDLMASAAAGLNLPFVDGSNPDWLGQPEHYVDNQHLTDAGHAEFGRLVGDAFDEIPVKNGCV